MSELIERYVHQVGQYLPPKERAEIEAELRSQIQDQLDDRYEESPTQAEVSAVLAELGAPHQMAARYSSNQYLVGPDLYPTMMLVLRQGWVFVPPIVIILSILGMLDKAQTTPLLNLFVETLFGVFQATFIFSAVIVLIFALIQRSGVRLDQQQMAFNPLDLPEVDDPRAVDRVESAFGITFGTIVSLVFLYFLRVGGMTLSFNLSNPGEVIPIPQSWTILFIAMVMGMVGMHALVLRRRRWDVAPWLIETVVELIATVCVYFVVSTPLVERALATIPTLSNIPFFESLPQIILVSSAVITIVTRGGRLIKLWNYRNSRTTFTTQPHR